MKDRKCPVCAGPIRRNDATWCSKRCAGLAKRTNRKCAAPDCDSPRKMHGYCQKHARRWLKSGTSTNPSLDRTESERFWSRVDKSGDCWLWTGEMNNQGYGRFSIWRNSKRTARHLAHRYALRDLGLLDESLIVLHACDTPLCVNPDHLSQGTQRDNVHDAMRKGRLNLSGLAIGQSLRRAS